MDYSPCHKKSQIWPKCLFPLPPKFAQDVIPVGVTLEMNYETNQFGACLSSDMEKLMTRRKHGICPGFFLSKEARQQSVLYQKVFIGFSNLFVVSITGTAQEIISQIKTKGGLLLQSLVLRWQKIKAIKNVFIMHTGELKKREHTFLVFFFFFLHFCKQYPSRDHIKTHYGK